MIRLKSDDAIEKLQATMKRIQICLSPAALEAEVAIIAEEAGEALLQASIRACMEVVYDMPEMTYDRTMALLESHIRSEVTNGPMFFEQHIGIDPLAEALGDTHAGRELVIDYAEYVHNGYTQWVWGYDSGQYVPGKEWFNYALVYAYPTIFKYIEQAFKNCITRAMREITI